MNPIAKHSNASNLQARAKVRDMANSLCHNHKLIVDKTHCIGYLEYVTTTYTTCCRTAAVNVAYETPIRYGENAGQLVTVTRRECASCHSVSPKMAYIATRTARGGRKTECGAACLGGKVSCDCRCNGRCHGADNCLCGEVPV